MLSAKLRRLDPYLIALLLLTALGLILRIYNLGYQSFWYDEGYTVNAALSMLERGLPFLPSGYFYSSGLLNTGLVASSMGLFGASEFSARLPSVLFGVLVIPLTFFFVRRIADRRVALVTAFLVTFSVLEIAWSRQARMYQQLQFFYILSLYFFYEFTEKRSNRYLILTVISTVGAILSHVFGFALILVYTAYLALTNIMNIRKFISKKFLPSKQTVIFTFCVIALLVLGVLFFNIFPTIRGTNMNYFGEYSGYLKETFPVILYLAPIGAIIFLRKDYKPSLLLILAVIVPLYFICFHIKMLGFRYLYFMLPAFFILFSYSVIYISDLLLKGKFKYVLSLTIIAIILGLTVYSPGFNFMPQSLYYLDRTAPQPDFKQAYNFINQNSRDGDIIIDTWPAVGKFYLERAPDYWLEFDIAGTTADYCVGEDKSREIYTNTLCLKNLDMLRSVIEENQSGWLVIDGLALFRLPPDTSEFIEGRLTYYEGGSSKTIAGEIKVYRWTH